MNTPLDWNLLKSFLAVIDHGSLIAASKALRVSQPTLGRNISTLEHATGLMLFERNRSGMIPTEAALRLVDDARAMAQSAQRLQVLAADQESKVSGTIRITASQVVSTHILPPILVALADEEPALDIELVATDKIANLLARDADIAIRMVRPEQNDLIAKKINRMALGAYAHRDYLARAGTPRSVDDLLNHTLIGYDRSDLMEQGMRALTGSFDRTLFRFRTDAQIAYWNIVLAGGGIGFGAHYIARKTPELIQVVSDMRIEPLPIWLTSHRELRHSAKVRKVYDVLSAALSALPLDRPGPGARADAEA